MTNVSAFHRLDPLMASSLMLWGAREGTGVMRNGDALVLTGPEGDVALTIRPAPAALRGLLRWQVTSADGSVRNCSSVLGLLDNVRDLLGLEREAVPLRLGVTGAAS